MRELLKPPARGGEAGKLTRSHRAGPDTVPTVCVCITFSFTTNAGAAQQDHIRIVVAAWLVGAVLVHDTENDEDEGGEAQEIDPAPFLDRDVGEREQRLAKR